MLGIIEGATEILPISSTGHLILAAELLGLDLGDPGVSAFLIVIQVGALLAVMGLYRQSVGLMIRGLMGRSPEGLRLFGLLTVAFVPAAVAGLLLDDAITTRLFSPMPVAFALGLGGVAILFIEWFRKRRGAELRESADQPRLALSVVTWRMALIIGLAQCLALWPGTSRSMVTIVAAVALGLSPYAAAEFSFLLALPTLGGASVYKLASEGSHILEATGLAGLALGLVLSGIVAAIAINTFLRYLTRHGLGVFGWYRIALAIIVVIVWQSP